MPSSFHFHISKMVDWIVKIQPQSILDVGVGFGKWGFLSREYTDIAAERYDPSLWQVRIDGVEAHPEYITPAHSYVYSSILHGDVRDLLPTLPEYDLIILGDVIEHFSKDDGQKLLAQLRAKSRYVLLSSPTVFFDQDVPENSFQKHRSFWTVDDFRGLQFDYEEYDHWLFVALVRGELADCGNIRLNPRASATVYSNRWLKARPKLAQIAKTIVARAQDRRDVRSV